MPIEKEHIEGYVALTEPFKEYLKHQVMKKGKRSLAAGWKVIPAHHRVNPNHDIIQVGYADVEESDLYWFGNPEKRDEHNSIAWLPIPIKYRRDKEFFREENAKWRPKYGFDMYMLLNSRSRTISEYVPEQGMGETARRVTTDAIEDPAERAAYVAHPEGGLSPEVLAQAREIIAQEKKEAPKTKRPKTETRLQAQ